MRNAHNKCFNFWYNDDDDECGTDYNKKEKVLHMQTKNYCTIIERIQNKELKLEKGKYEYSNENYGNKSVTIAKNKQTQIKNKKSYRVKENNLN